jgi:hypothetical protein
MSRSLLQLIETIFSKQKDEPDPLDAYKLELLKLYEKSNDLFEKQLSYIAAGSLGLSMIIIDKVLKDIYSTRFKGCLVASWILFGATLILNLYSQPFAAKKYYKTIEEINSGQYDQTKANLRSKSVRNLNLFCLCTLLIGIVSFIIYVSVNILNGY